MIKMIHGDCLEYMKTMIDKIDVVITDPPYGINLNTKRKKWNGGELNYKKIYGDDADFNPSLFIDFNKVILWGANNYTKNLPFGGWLVWDKRVKESCDKMFGSPFELAWCSNPKLFKICRLQHGGVVNADSSCGNNQKRVHPTQKPIRLMEWCIELISKEGDTIFDPFAGSGTTGIA